jgi:hypothetical protein
MGRSLYRSDIIGDTRVLKEAVDVCQWARESIMRAHLFMTDVVTLLRGQLNNAGQLFANCITVIEMAPARPSPNSA